jgi:hypothetical protein
MHGDDVVAGHMKSASHAGFEDTLLMPRRDRIVLRPLMDTINGLANVAGEVLPRGPVRNNAADVWDVHTATLMEETSIVYRWKTLQWKK